MPKFTYQDSVLSSSMDLAMPNYLKSGRREEAEGGPARGQAVRKGGEKGFGKGSKASSSAAAAPRVDEELLKSIALLSLETAMAGRELMAMNTTTALMEDDFPMVVAGLEAGRMFAQKVKDNPGTNVGSPHIAVAIDGLLALSKLKELDAEFQAVFQKWWATSIAGKEEDDIAAAITIFKIRKPQTQTKSWKKKKESDDAEEYARVQFSIVNKEFHYQLAAQLGKLGAVLKHGPAPKSYNERNVSKLLRTMQ